MSTPNVCPNCSAELTEGAKFCTACGASISAQEAADATNAPEATKESAVKKLSSFKDKVAKKIGDSGIISKAKSNPNLVRDAAVLLLALVMLICAFMPIVRFDQEIELGKIEDTISFKISPFTSVGFLFDAMKDQTGKEISKSALYDRYEDKLEILEDISSKAKKLTAKERNALNDILLITAKMTLRSEDTHATFSLLVSALVSLAYILLALGLFAVSVLNILSHFGGKKSLYPLALKLLAAVPFTALIAYFTVKMPLSGLATGDMKVKMGGSLALVILSLIGIIALVAYNVFTGKIKLDIKAFAYRALTVVLAIVTVCMVSAPALGATVKAEFGGKKKQEAKVALDATAFLELETSKDEMKTIEKYLGKEKAHKDALTAKFASFAFYTTKQVGKGEMDSTVSEALLYSYVSGGAGLKFLVARAPYLTLTAVAMLALVAWAALNELLTGEKKNLKIATIVMVAAFAASLLLALIYVLAINGRLADLKLDSTLKARIGSSYLLVALFGAIAMLLPLAAKKLGINTELAFAPATEAPAIAAPAEEVAAPEAPAEEALDDNSEEEAEESRDDVTATATAE